MGFLDSILQKFTGKKKPDAESVVEEEVSETIPQGSPDEQMLKQILDSVDMIAKDVGEQITGVQNRVTTLEGQSKDDSAFKLLDERVTKLETQLSQFTKVYELITNQYSPFLGEKTPAPIKTKDDVVEAEVKAKSDEATTSANSPTVDSHSVKDEVVDSSDVVSKDAVGDTEKVAVNEDETLASDVAELTGDTPKSIPAVAKAHKAAVDEYVPKLPAKRVSSEHAFVTYSNHTIHSIAELRDALHEIDDEEFSEFVTSEKNDFANWISLALGEQDFAQKVAKFDSRAALVHFLDSY